MKYTIFFCLFSFAAFSQKTIFDSIYLNPNFREVNLTEQQQASIANEFKTKNRSAAAIAEINLYAYSVLMEDQKILYDKAWRKYTSSIIHSYHHYLNLTDQQKSRLLAAMESIHGSDTFKIVKYFPPIPMDTLVAMLDPTQLVLEAEHQNQIKLNFETHTREGDAAKSAGVAFEKKRLQLIKSQYFKHLLKANQTVRSKIANINPRDIKKLDTMATLYHARLMLDLDLEIKKCYDRDSVLIAPLQKQLLEYRYERFAFLPNLCIYWCKMGTAKTPEIVAEEKTILTGLEYFKTTYSTLFTNIIEKLNPKRRRLITKIEASRPKIKGGSVTIVAEEYIKSLENIAELLLIKPY